MNSSDPFLPAWASKYIAKSARELKNDVAEKPYTAPMLGPKIGTA